MESKYHVLSQKMVSFKMASYNLKSYLHCNLLQDMLDAADSFSVMQGISNYPT